MQKEVVHTKKYFSDKDREFNMREYKLKNCLLKTVAKKLDYFFIYFFIAAGKRNAMNCSLHCLTDTIMNMWFYKTA